MPAAAAQRPCLIVTRPEPEAARWVQALRARGQDALALPLIRIAPLLPDAAQAWPAESPAALMFVSGAAVRAVFAQRPAAALGAHTRCWCTGPGTAAALREAGVPPARIDCPPPDAPQFDSEALWAVVRDRVPPGTRVCIVRGGDAEGRPAGRDWLAGTLAAAGAVVDTVVVYRRLPPADDAAWRAALHRALAAPGPWLFSSSEALRNLQALCPDANWSTRAALATHARIAAAARAAGFGRVRKVPPVLDAVLAALDGPDS